jgi:hypothetical protein
LWFILDNQDGRHVTPSQQKANKNPKISILGRWSLSQMLVAELLTGRTQ